VALDLRELSDNTYLDQMGKIFSDKLKFVAGNAEDLQFDSNSFDRVFSTCLLHHVDEPLNVLMEARRVTIIGGQIVYVLPTDPGILNQLIKRLVSYPALRRFTEYDPAFLYSLEHKNHVGGLIRLIKFIYEEDDIKITYYPFRWPSWNLNLAVGVNIIKSSSDPVYLKREIF
jgi:ubiquinone/menaquinone biosynthesis C-methylase UbiE